MLVLTRADGDGIELETSDGRVRLWMERTGRHRIKVYCEAPREIGISRIDKTGQLVGTKKCPSTTTTT